jgi:hypothetical protein
MTNDFDWEADIGQVKTAGGTPRVNDGGDCPECTGKGNDYRANCPTCEGTGKQMFVSDKKIRPPKPKVKDYNKMTSAKLKSRLAAIGIKFPDDNEKPKTFEDVQREHTRKQEESLHTPEENKRINRLDSGKRISFSRPEQDARDKYIETGTKIRPPRPKRSEFKNIISAARDHIREAKIDTDHQHSIEWHVQAKGQQRTAYLIDTQPNRRFTKYWLLNAKQVNGNGWGVDPSTIDENIQKFVGKPFVVTAQSWIPDSEYGNSYVHPYIPTNNLRRIFQHQAKYTVGVVRRIIKDEKDDYYAMIEKLPKFAHMRDPPFCSPGIFQMDRNEPMDKIRTWEPLHLAGLEEDPAYGAHVALLKGNCVGTENECYVQFRGAKLEVVTQCPIRNARKGKLKERLEGVVLEASANKVVEAFKKKEVLKSGNHSTDGKAYYLFGNKIAEQGDPKEPNFGDYMLDSSGGYYGPLSDDHSGYIADYYQDEAIPEHLVPKEDEDRYEKYFTETGDIRVIHEDGYTNHIMYKKPTTEQVKAMEETEKEFPDHVHSYQLVLPGIHHVENHNNINDFKLFLHGEKTKEDTARHNLLKQFHQGKLIDTEETPQVKINPSHGAVIANAYGKMKHAPNDPYVKSAYGALINETKQQYRDLLDKGLKIDRITGDNPYKNSKDMHKDLEENNHLHYFPTESGFGQGEENKDHPMMQPTEFKDKEHTLLANDVFRIVHDINGHHRGGKTGFGPTGEHQAYLTHKKMFTPLANKALFTETAGQNNYVNFGPNGEHNRTDPKNTIYAQQKAGIMPSHITNGRFHNV